MRHLDGTEVHPVEVEMRAQADELVWMQGLLHYSGAEPEAGRVLTVTEDALRPGPARRPYWQAVADFEERHRAELEAILHLDVAQPLVAGFRARFAYLFVLARGMDTTEPIEEFDTEFQRYLDEIARMIHELKYLFSQKVPPESGMTLLRAQKLADSHVIARVFDEQRKIVQVKHGTRLPVVGPDGRLEGSSRPAILTVGRVEELGTFPRRSPRGLRHPPPGDLPRAA